MDLRTLQYFVTVAEELNITRAAEKLHMSQPPLSAQIRNLESELETVLFIRGRRQLQLTESGQLLYRRAKEILNLSAERYVEFLSMLLTSAMREQLADEEKSLAIYGEAESNPEDFIILLNERDRDRIGNALTEKLQAKKAAGELAFLPEIATELANIDGGLILRRGKIEINCSVGALFGELRPEYEGRVVARLFAEKKG
jgi:DNA-binding Lrp family transcriptional regulator